MSVTTLPSLNVGGKVTQEVIKHIPTPPSKSSLRPSRQKRSQQEDRLNSFEHERSSTSASVRKDKPTKGDGIIDTARYLLAAFFNAFKPEKGVG